MERLLARDLLPGIDLLAKDVEAGRRVVQRKPGVVRRDVNAVFVQAGVDAAREDLRKKRPDRQPVGARNAAEPAEPGHRNATVQVLRRASWSGVAKSACCRPQRRVLMPNSWSIAS